jgi:hypothetical protein
MVKPFEETQDNSKAEEGKSFDLESLIKMGVTETEAEISPELTVKVKTLTEDERRKVLVMTGERDLSLDSKMKIPILMFAITEVNGKKIETDEDRAKLVAILNKMQYFLVDTLFLIYLKAFNSQYGLYEEGLKKNSLITPSVESIG